MIFFDIRYLIYIAAFLPDSFVTFQDSAVDFDPLKNKGHGRCMRNNNLMVTFPWRIQVGSLRLDVDAEIGVSSASSEYNDTAPLTQFEITHLFHLVSCSNNILKWSEFIIMVSNEQSQLGNTFDLIMICIQPSSIFKKQLQGWPRVPY